MVKSLDVAREAAKKEKERLDKLAREEKDRRAREEADRARKERDAPVVKDMAKEVQNLLDQLDPKGVDFDGTESGGLDFVKRDGSKLKFQKGTKDSAPVDNRTKEKSKPDADPKTESNTPQGGLDFMPDRDGPKDKKSGGKKAAGRDDSSLFRKNTREPRKEGPADPKLRAERAKRDAELAEMEKSFQRLNSESYQEWLEDEMTDSILKQLGDDSSTTQDVKFQKVLAEARERIAQRRTAESVKLQARAMEEMDAEMAKFKKQGLLKGDESPGQKAAADPAFRKAFDDACRRTREKLDKSQRELNERCKDDLFEEISRILDPSGGNAEGTAAANRKAKYLKALSDVVNGIVIRENKEMIKARGLALDDMQSEMERLKKQGVWKEGDDLLKKEQTDPAFRKAVDDARDRTLEKFDKTRREILDRSRKEAQTQVGRLNKELLK